MKKIFMALIMLMALSTATIAGIGSGSYDMCLFTLDMEKIGCTMDIQENFVVEGNQWAIGDMAGRIEDAGAFTRLYITNNCFSPCINESLIGYYSYVGDGWLTDMNTRIILIQTPIDYDAICNGFSPPPSWCD